MLLCGADNLVACLCSVRMQGRRRQDRPRHLWLLVTSEVLPLAGSAKPGLLMRLCG